SLWIDVVLPCSPAAKAGLKKDQRLVGLNCQSVIGWGEIEALHWLRSYPDSRDLTVIVQDSLPNPLTDQHFSNPNLHSSSP
ncbi:hypothetical protein Ciccas_011673, partial [Cichlidogyrus casuarinus]